MEERKKTLSQTILVTVIAFNLMLGGLLVTRNLVNINGISPVIAAPSEDNVRVDYVMEYTGSDRVKENPVTSPTGQEGTWVVEHYKEYECHYNKKGEIIYKEPTSKEDNIRYWTDKNNHSY